MFSLNKINSIFITKEGLAVCIIYDDKRLVGIFVPLEEWEERTLYFSDDITRVIAIPARLELIMHYLNKRVE